MAWPDVATRGAAGGQFDLMRPTCTRCEMKPVRSTPQLGHDPNDRFHEAQACGPCRARSALMYRCPPLARMDPLSGRCARKVGGAVVMPCARRTEDARVRHFGIGGSGEGGSDRRGPCGRPGPQQPRAAFRLCLRPMRMLRAIHAPEGGRNISRRERQCRLPAGRGVLQSRCARRHAHVVSPRRRLRFQPEADAS